MPGGGGEGRLAGDAVTTMRAGATRSPRRGRGGDGSAGPAWAGETGRGGACREEQGRHGSARALGGKGEAQPGKMRRGGRRGHGAIPGRGGSGEHQQGARSFAATEEGRRRRPPERGVATREIQWASAWEGEGEGEDKDWVVTDGSRDARDGAGGRWVGVVRWF